jgi:hypothetical protein
MVMGVYCPEEKKFKKLAYFTEIYKSGNSIFVQNGGQKIPLDDGFLYNGLDLYLFVKKTTVKWNNRVFVLEPLSYAVVTYNKRLELYPYQGGGSIHEDTGDCEVMAETQSGFSINLSMDILRRADGIEQLLFFQPSSLKKME